MTTFVRRSSSGRLKIEFSDSYTFQKFNSLVHKILNIEADNDINVVFASLNRAETFPVLWNQFAENYLEGELTMVVFSNPHSGSTKTEITISYSSKGVELLKKILIDD